MMEGHRSMELEEFMTGVGDQLDQTNETLGQWFTQIQTIFYKVMKEKKPVTLHFISVDSSDDHLCMCFGP